MFSLDLSLMNVFGTHQKMTQLEFPARSLTVETFSTNSNFHIKFQNSKQKFNSAVAAIIAKCKISNNLTSVRNLVFFKLYCFQKLENFDELSAIVVFFHKLSKVFVNSFKICYFYQLYLAFVNLLCAKLLTPLSRKGSFFNGDGREN